MNGRSRPVIFEDMKKRIERGDIMAERKEAIKVRFIAYLPNIILRGKMADYLTGYVRHCIRSSP